MIKFCINWEAIAAVSTAVGTITALVLGVKGISLSNKLVISKELDDLDETRRHILIIIESARQRQVPIDHYTISTTINALQYHSKLIDGTEAEAYRVLLATRKVKEIMEVSEVYLTRVNEKIEKFNN